MLTIASAISIASIFPAVVVSFIIFNRNKLFLPFLLLIIVSGLVEFTALLLRYQSLNNVWLYNLAILAQFYFMIWQLSKWGLFRIDSIVVKISLALVSLLWIAEMYYYRNQNLNNYTLVLGSLLLIVFITAYINRLIFENVKFLLTDSRFLICIGYLIYFTISLIIFIFTQNGKDFSAGFFTNIWAIHNIINTFTNIIFTVALLCIPKR
jgi:hypothetical protein